VKHTERSNAKLELPSENIRKGSLTRRLDICIEFHLETPFD
jgi:hypothetical protein